MRGEKAAGTNEVMSKPLRILAALLACLALTTSPALAATPAKASADFAEKLFSPVDGVLGFEETADGIKVTGAFEKGFASAKPADYQLLILDGAETVVDFTKDFQKVAEIAPPKVDQFTFTTATKKKINDIRNEDAVVRQLVDVAAGIKVLAEIGRARVQKA